MNKPELKTCTHEIVQEAMRVVSKDVISPKYVRNMSKCNKNGIKREGESCNLNNNCIYPNCKIPTADNDVISNYKKFIDKLIKKASIDMKVNKVDNYKFFHSSKEYKYVIYGLDYIKSLGYTIVKIDSFYSYLVTIDAHWAHKL